MDFQTMFGTREMTPNQIHLVWYSCPETNQSYLLFEIPDPERRGEWKHYKCGDDVPYIAMQQEQWKVLNTYGALMALCLRARQVWDELEQEQREMVDEGFRVLRTLVPDLKQIFTRSLKYREKSEFYRL